jgi:hypothetical protein
MGYFFLFLVCGDCGSGSAGNSAGIYTTAWTSSVQKGTPTQTQRIVWAVKVLDGQPK